MTMKIGELEFDTDNIVIPSMLDLPVTEWMGASRIPNWLELEYLEMNAAQTTKILDQCLPAWYTYNGVKYYLRTRKITTQGRDETGRVITWNIHLGFVEG